MLKIHHTAIGILFILSIATIQHVNKPTKIHATNTVPDVDLLNPFLSYIDDGATFCSYQTYVNGTSYQQDVIITYRGWQYTTYYNSSNELVVTRRKLPAGSWNPLILEKSSGQKYILTNEDSHRSPVIGISPEDDRLHIAFDHHNDSLQYIRSKPNLLTEPNISVWSISDFEDKSSPILDPYGAVVNSVTYPLFVTTPTNKLQMFWRNGGSGNGEWHLAEYSAENWTYIGKFTSESGIFTDTDDNGNEILSDSRNAYLNGVNYDYVGGRLHITWTWREDKIPGVPNHDLGYAYSDDYGRTWHNNEGRLVARTSPNPIQGELISINSPGHTVDVIGTDYVLMNQEGQTVDNHGRIHVIISYSLGAIGWFDGDDFYDQREANAELVHYWRDHDGTWYKNPLGILSTPNRSKIAFDSSDNAYVIAPSLRIITASADSNWTDWTIRYNDSVFYGDPLLDTSRLRDESTLSVFAAEENDCLDGGVAKLYVLDFELPDSDTNLVFLPLVVVNG